MIENNNGERRWHVFIPCNPPTRTAQQKGAMVRGGHVHFFTKKAVKDAQSFLAALIKAELDKLTPGDRGSFPIEGPIALGVEWRFPFRKSESKRLVESARADGKAIAHSVRPDLDNLVKGLLDTMTRLGIWGDDAQISQLYSQKGWGEPTGIVINLVWRARA